jgi:hypothetical protein
MPPDGWRLRFNMDDQRKCLRCGGAMEPGQLTIPFRRLRWVPQTYWKLVRSLRLKFFHLVSYRCTKCGTLETVAEDTAGTDSPG